MAGLGVFGGSVVKFPHIPRLKIPHMGWNTARLTDPKNYLWQDLGTDPFFYFVHSYYPQPTDPSIIATHTAYGPVDFASSVQVGNVQATQFHPEKSQANGLRLLHNFVNRWK
jgi:glutamine amidotransferase